MTVCIPLSGCRNRATAGDQGLFARPNSSLKTRGVNVGSSDLIELAKQNSGSVERYTIQADGSDLRRRESAGQHCTFGRSNRRGGRAINKTLLGILAACLLLSSSAITAGERNKLPGQFTGDWCFVGER
jgi:hypothetical protein